jgi:hypothetical protein
MQFIRLPYRTKNLPRFGPALGLKSRKDPQRATGHARRAVKPILKKFIDNKFKGR